MDRRLVSILDKLYVDGIRLCGEALAVVEESVRDEREVVWVGNVGNLNIYSRGKSEPQVTVGEAAGVVMRLAARQLCVTVVGRWHCVKMG